MFDSAEKIAFWILAAILAVVASGLVIAVARWLIDRGYGPK
jgi:hypothetical protein